MLELIEEVDGEIVKEWSKERLKAEMEDTKMSDLSSAICGIALGFLGLLLFFCFMATIYNIQTERYNIALEPGFCGIIFLGIIVFSCWYLYERHKRYNKLKKLWKARL